MPDWRRLARDRVLTLGLAARQEADLIEELAGQMEEIYASALAEGASEGDARQRALACLPARNAFGFARPNLLPDLTYAWRLHARQPGFLLAAVVAIGLAIGACTTIYSLLDAVVLRPLDYANPRELVMVWEQYRGGPENVVSPANYLEWRGRTQAFLASSPVVSMTRNLTGVGEPVEVGIEAVSWNYLRMLGGVELVLGRDFVAEDDHPDTPAAVLLGYRLWTGRFGGDRGVIGRRLQLDGVEVVVVGVLPAGFHSLSEDPEMLTTARLDAAVDYRGRGRFMRVVARVGDVAFAQRELSALARQLERERPAFNQGWGVRVVPLGDHFSARGRGALWTLMAAVALVLLVVCGNLANLLLAKLSARQREMAVRFALGATPLRLAAQLLHESLLLAALGGLLGCALAWAGVTWLRESVDVPRLATAAVDARVLGFALAVSVGAALLFGFTPAVAASRSAVGRAVGRSPRRSAFTTVFVVFQVGLTLVLLLGATTLIQRFRDVLAAWPGFEASRVLTMSLALPGSRDARAFFAELEARLRRLPELEAVGAVAWLPLAGPPAATTVEVLGRPQSGEALAVDVQIVTSGYFPAMQIAQETTLPQEGVYLSRSAARLLFPEGNSLGQQVIVRMRDHDQPRRVAGVVDDVRQLSLETAPRPTVYYRHEDFALPAMTVVMRAKPGQLTGGLQSAAVAMVREMDPAQPVRTLRTMSDWVGRSLAERRLVASACGAFAALAVGLALMGVYGAFSRLVEERRQELGIRLALGADRADVLRLLAREGIATLGAGLVFGLLLYWWPARSWGLSPNPLVLPLTIFAFVSLAAAAFVGPATKAMQLDPLVVLRQE